MEGAARGKSYGQATKGARGMPWQEQAKKDAASCENPRGAASKLGAGGVRMGEPGGSATPAAAGLGAGGANPGK